MPQSTAIDKVARFYWILLIPAGLLIFLYSWTSWGFFTFVGGRIGRLLGIHALLAFPLFLVVFVSLKLGFRLLWLYVASKFVFLAVISFSSPHYHISYRVLYFPFQLLFYSSWADRWLIAAAILTHVAYLLKRRSQQAPDKKVDHDIPAN